MKKAEWKKVIMSACDSAGTYQACFDPVIDTLAAILEKRDKAQADFDRRGESMIVMHTNKGGNANPIKHPLLQLVNELNRDALNYWRELGLTPSSLRKINDKAMEQKKESALVAALKELS